MIDVRVRKDHRVDLVHGERDTLVFLPHIRSPSLEQAEIEKDRLAEHANDVTGTGHFACGTVELDFHGRRLVWGEPAPREAGGGFAGCG